ncbi:MAG: hypothetical protein ABSG98_12235 [Anaerolineales bacterium]|jgi:hypothetical protein
MRRLLRAILTRENLWALVLGLVLVALVVLTANSGPRWIYQGF